MYGALHDIFLCVDMNHEINENNKKKKREMSHEMTHLQYSASK